MPAAFTGILWKSYPRHRSRSAFRQAILSRAEALRALLIPGTAGADHLEENLASAFAVLDEQMMAELNTLDVKFKLS
jgi:diketogulonate reductase-like aldo/keto reductase